MSEGIDIPFKLSGADAAKIALDAVVASFTGLEREVISVAQKSDTAKVAFEGLKTQFADGKISADEMRAALARIADQAPKVGTAVKGAMSEGARGATGLREALTNVKDAGLQELSQKAGELGQRLGGVTGQIAQVAIRSLAAFGPVGVALTGVGAALAFATQAYEAHKAAVELADAQVRELASSEQNLGAAYPSVSAAVAGATTAVEAHTRAIEEQQRVLGQQLTLMGQAFSGGEALQFVTQIQQVAGAARELGTFLRGASEDQIRATIETGNATQQQELLGVAFSHSSNAVEEHQRRLDAIVVLQHRAAEAVAAHKDELVSAAQAQLAEARAEAAAALEIDDNGRAHADAMRRVEAATNDLATAQNRAAEAHRNAAEGAGDATRALDALDAATRSDAEAANAAALQRGYARLRQIGAAQRRRASSGARAEEPGKSAKADEMAADERDRQRDLAQMRATKEFYAELVRQARDYENAIHGAAESWGEQITHAHELARIQARIAGLNTEAQAANEVRLARARMAQQRAEGSISARAEMSDLRDPSTRAARIEEMAQQHQLQRERAHLEQRYQLQRTYSDRMEELHGQEFNSTQALAEGVSGAFQKMGEALEMHIEGLINGKESVGEALQGMLADTLGMIGKQAFVKGAMETAEGISALAGIVTAPLAPGHFAAAAAYFGVGALATAAGYGVASIGGGSTPASASAAPSQPAARVSKGSASSGEGGTIINVAFGGPMYGTGGVRQAAREITGVVNRGAIQGGVQLLPGVLMGGGAGS